MNYLPKTTLRKLRIEQLAKYTNLIIDEYERLTNEMVKNKDEESMREVLNCLDNIMIALETFKIII